MNKTQIHNLIMRAEIALIHQYETAFNAWVQELIASDVLAFEEIREGAYCRWVDVLSGDTFILPRRDFEEAKAGNSWLSTEDMRARYPYRKLTQHIMPLVTVDTEGERVNSYQALNLASWN